MPIEIRELHIKAIVEKVTEDTSNSQEGANSEQMEERIIRSCIERVMGLLEEAQQR